MNHLTPDRNVGKPITIPLLMFLIEHPKGLVLFDTGVDTDAVGRPRSSRRRRNSGSTGRWSGWDTGRTTSGTSILSHLHLDHVGCMPLFPDATFIVRRQELRAAWWPDAYERGYDFDSLLKTRDLKYLQPGGDEAFDVFGDGSLVCIDTKGHTEGHQSLVVDSPEVGEDRPGRRRRPGGRELQRQRPSRACAGTASSPVESIQKLQHLQAQGALVILGHELSALDTLKLAPDYYE